MGKIKDVFISYSRKNKTFVAQLEADIRADERQFATWIDWHDIPPTAEWEKEIYDAIESAKNFLCVVSPQSLASEICNLEIAHAIKHEKPIIPLVFRDINERDMAGEWIGQSWDQTARDNWAHLKHLNWIFCRIQYGEQEIEAYREQHPDQPDGLPVEDDYREALKHVLDTIEVDQEHKQEHTRYTLAAEEWVRGGRKPESLLRGENADVAWKWLIASETKIPPATSLQRAFINQSIDQQRREERERQQQHARELSLQTRVKRLWQYLGSGLATLLCVVLVLLLITNEARQSEQKAKTQAIVERDRALTNESLTLSALARQELVVDPVASINLSIQALPQQPEDRPYVAQAESALNEAIQTSLERTYLDVDETIPTQAIAYDDTTQLVAIGGDTLRVVPYNLDDAKILRSDSDHPIAGVAWSDNGTLLSYDANTVQVWYAGVPLEHTFEDGVVFAAWRPNSREIAVCSGNAIWGWAAQSGQAPERLAEFDGRVKALRWSDDGRWLAAWDQHQQHSTVVLWDAQDRRLALQQELDGLISDIAWSSDHRHFMSWAVQVTPDQKTLTSDVYVWDTAKPEEPVLLLDYAGKVERAQFLDDGVRALIWASDGTVQLRNINDESYRVSFNVTGSETGGSSGQPVGNIVLSPDENTLLALMNSGIVTVWDVAGGTQVATLRGHRAKIRATVWHNDLVVTASADHTIRVWNSRSGDELITLYGHADEVLDVRWIDPRTLLSTGWDGTLRLWQVLDNNGLPLCTGRDADGTPRCRAMSSSLSGHTSALDAVRWADGTTIVTADRDGQVMRWHTASSAGSPVPGERNTKKVVLTADGQRFLSFDNGGPGQVVDTATGDTLYTVDGSLEDGIWLDPYWLISYSDGSARLIDGMSGQAVTELDGFQGVIRSAALNPEAQTLALIDSSGTVGLWNSSSGQHIGEMPSANESRASLAWSSKGRYLLTVGAQVTLWDGARMERVWEHDLGAFPQNALIAFNPQDTRVAVAVTDWISNAATIWDVETGSVLVKATGVDTYTLGLMWNTTGSRLLIWGSESDAGFIRVWDVATREPVLDLTQPASITAAAFSPDDTRIVTGDERGLVVIWQTAASYQALITTAQTCCQTREITLNSSAETQIAVEGSNG